LPASRQGTRWLSLLKTLVVYRLLDPGSEWRLHRHWYRPSALGDLLGDDEGVAESDTLYRCLDKLLVHTKPFFSYLRARWQDLFGVCFAVLLYDQHLLRVRSAGVWQTPVRRRNEKRAMCRRRLTKLWRRLHELQRQQLTHDELLLKLGATTKEAGRAYALFAIQLPDPGQQVTPVTFTFAPRKDKLRIVRRREVSYLLRSDLTGEDPAAIRAMAIPYSDDSIFRCASDPDPFSR
jgi:hypothetical protein